VGKDLRDLSSPKTCRLIPALSEAPVIHSQERTIRIWLAPVVRILTMMVI